MSDRHAHPARIATALADIFAASAAASGAYALRFHSGLLDVTGRTDVLPENYLRALPVVAACGLASTAIAGLQERRRTLSTPRAADAIRAAAIFGATLAVLALLWWKEFQYSRAVLVASAVLFAPIMMAARGVALHALIAIRRDRFRTPAIVVCDESTAASFADELSRSDWIAVDIVGIVIPEGHRAPWPDAARLPTITAAADAVSSGRAREVFIALPAARTHELPAMLDTLAQTTADVRVVPDLGNAVLMNPGLLFVGSLPVLTARESPLFGARAAMKRCVDVVLAAACLVILTPLLLLVALLVKVCSPGPILYAQERMGLDGANFRMWKFRTMREDAEAKTGPAFAQPNDPRTTPLGRFLRRFSIDELPQLWNVLRGEMSLVGPRPERGPFIEELRRRFPGYMLRHSVKAGMTGWAQVHGLRGESSRELRLRYDLEYIERWSLSLDAEILGRTAFQVLLGRNAY